MQHFTIIEIEKKFLLRSKTNIHELLIMLGAKQQGRISFTDAYYDRPSLLLSRNGFWLRLRDDSWQLKVAADRKAIRAGVDVYEEITTEKDICARIQDLARCAGQSLEVRQQNLEEKELNRIGNAPGSDSDVSLVDDLIHRVELSQFAKFVTDRTSYTLDEFRIDIDTADFGHSIAEVELEVKTPADMDSAAREALVADAVKRIEELMASRLEEVVVKTSPGERVPGKLDEYLRLFSPNHLQALLQSMQ